MNRFHIACRVACVFLSAPARACTRSPPVDVGPYSITAEAKGFKKLPRSGIVIQTASRASLELRLELGDVTQSVEVPAKLRCWPTTPSDVGTNFRPKFVKDAPLFVGRRLPQP